jgi:cellulose synthase/poly-beta-1,6-N-acetylglucosamine synthase-like glycosyltransferase
LKVKTSKNQKLIPQVSLIISFYNDPKFLELILAALEIQSFNAFEVIIADDGSNAHVVKTVGEMIDRYPFSIKHVWHEDKGFRKTTILNSAIKASNTNYLIFIDGDCIPHPKFVGEHYQNREDSVALTGRRVNLSKRVTLTITPDLVRNGALQGFLFRQLLVDGILGKARNVEMGFYIRNRFLRKFFNRKARGLKGCNMSFNKKDLIAVNGFDERYCGPSTGEDTDIGFRLQLNGVRVKNLKNIAILYHRHHRKIERGDAANKPIFDKTKKDKLIFTPYGLKK